jgi:glycosyltransferase involved in cell wall biosynthesis
VAVILSIIIPLYNAENYIVETIDSVVSEMPDNVEVIIVNDGSTDNSVALIKNKFSSQLNSGELLLLQQPNSGVSVARNTGIENSKGDYITFVDSDDLLFEDYYTSVFSVINNTAPDIIDIGYRRFSDENDLKNNPDMFTYNKFGSLKTDKVLSNIFASSFFYSWARIIKKTVLGGLRFPAGVNYCEDMIFLYQLYQKSETIYHIDKALYAYRDNPEGATRNMKPDYLEAMLALYQKLLKDNRPEISYLKITVFYVIYSCSGKIGKAVRLPLNVFIDSKKLAIKFFFDKEIPLRKKMILFMPNIHQKLACLKSYCKSRR